MLIFYRLPFATSTSMLPCIRTCKFSWATTDWVSKEFHLVSTLDWEKQSLWAFFLLALFLLLLVLRCPVLLAPANGRLENAACGNLFGSTCRLTCNKGYEIKGTEERKCEKKPGTNTVHWTGNGTHCEGRKTYDFIVQSTETECGEMWFSATTIIKGCLSRWKVDRDDIYKDDNDDGDKNDNYDNWEQFSTVQ